MSRPRIPQQMLEFPELFIPATQKHAAARWVNVFDDSYLGKKVINLYATETLYGDWSGRVLFLAQDALPAEALRRLIQTYEEKGEPKTMAWRHADSLLYGDTKGVKTNSIIRELKEKHLPTTGVLYGSATGHVLFDEHENFRGREGEVDPRYRQSLRGFYKPELFAHFVYVLRWVVTQMPNLEFILCLGQKAWDVSVRASSTSIAPDFRETRAKAKEASAEIEGKRLLLVPAYHPAAIITRDSMERNWVRLSQLLCAQRIAS
jgi:hypothetical protein